MNQVAEIDRLYLLGIEGHGEKNPPNDKGGQEAGKKIDQSALERFRDQIRNIG
jgi:hypothetical protein